MLLTNRRDCPNNDVCPVLGCIYAEGMGIWAVWFATISCKCPPNKFTPNNNYLGRKGSPATFVPTAPAIQPLNWCPSTSQQRTAKWGSILVRRAEHPFAPQTGHQMKVGQPPLGKGKKPA
eukprot:EG_transcript_35190